MVASTDALSVTAILKKSEPPWRRGGGAGGGMPVGAAAGWMGRAARLAGWLAPPRALQGVVSASAGATAAARMHAMARWLPFSAAAGGPQRLVTLIEGESLLNDASGGWAFHRSSSGRNKPIGGRCSVAAPPVAPAPGTRPVRRVAARCSRASLCLQTACPFPARCSHHSLRSVQKGRPGTMRWRQPAALQLWRPPVSLMRSNAAAAAVSLLHG